uniref:hypothetical protein n=1 Tax=Klebsiella oxytoca TaxID=571 RepID=UPI001BD456E1
PGDLDLIKLLILINSLIIETDFSVMRRAADCCENIPQQFYSSLLFRIKIYNAGIFYETE